MHLRRFFTWITLLCLTMETLAFSPSAEASSSAGIKQRAWFAWLHTCSKSSAGHRFYLPFSLPGFVKLSAAMFVGHKLRIPCEQVLPLGSSLEDSLAEKNLRAEHCRQNSEKELYGYIYSSGPYPSHETLLALSNDVEKQAELMSLARGSSAAIIDKIVVLFAGLNLPETQAIKFYNDICQGSDATLQRKWGLLFANYLPIALAEFRRTILSLRTHSDNAILVDHLVMIAKKNPDSIDRLTLELFERIPKEKFFEKELISNVSSRFLHDYCMRISAFHVFSYPVISHQVPGDRQLLIHELIVAGAVNSFKNGGGHCLRAYFSGMQQLGKGERNYFIYKGSLEQRIEGDPELMVKFILELARMKPENASIASRVLIHATRVFLNNETAAAGEKKLLGFFSKFDTRTESPSYVNSLLLDGVDGPLMQFLRRRGDSNELQLWADVFQRLTTGEPL